MIINKINELTKGNEEVPIVVIPFGTGNDFYESCGFNTLKNIEKHFQEGIRMPLDIGN
jgi:diacylglycerol kinase family enzyme